MLYRIIDVNLNRAREATRVIEDYARFVLDNQALYESARDIRHQLIVRLKPISRHLIAARDITGDVGKDHPATARTNAEVVLSNLKRLQEALRSIIEYLKTNQPTLARKIEPLRFRAYQLEQKFSCLLHPKQSLAQAKLYVLIPKISNTAVTAILGDGADIIQLRAKEMSDNKLLTLARNVRQLTARYHKLFIINDRVDIAYLANADGVHLGETNVTVRNARRILGPDKIIGATSHNIKEALQAQQDGADYISVGPFYPTPLKPNLKPSGFTYLKDVTRRIHIPYFLIGGITATNLTELRRCHKKFTDQPFRIAISSWLLSQPNLRDAISKLKRLLY